MPLYIVLGVVGIGALFGILFLLFSGDDDSGDGEQAAEKTDETLPPEEDPAPPPEEGDDPAPPAEGGGWDGTPTTGGSTESTELSDGLVLNEYGFSNVTYFYDSAEFRSSWGLVIENTGSETAENFLINVTLYDADGGVIDSLDKTINVLPSGEKIGIGETLLTYDHGTPIGEMEVQYGGKEDFVEDRGDSISGSLTTSNITTEQANEYSITTTFKVESSYDVPAENPASYVILRNTSGEIIGGSQGYELTYIGGGSSSDTKVDALARFDEVDIAMDQTEAYVDFGY